MDRGEADNNLEEVIDFIREKFPDDETCFGVVLIVKTVEYPDGEMAFAGTLTLDETGGVIEAYLDAAKGEAGEETYPLDAGKKPNTLN